MNKIYFSMALVVLYGDIVKRFLSPQPSLFLLYSAAIIILAALVLVRKTRRLSGTFRKEGRVIQWLVLLLIVTYLFQLLTSFSSPFIKGIIHVLYICIPLLYIVVIQKYCPQFDLSELAKYFLLLMVPVNFVGLVQYFIDPNFLVSNVYTEYGGIIIRNFLFGGNFARFPAIFASADRYSSMGLMQFYFTFVLFLSTGKMSKTKGFWIVFNFASAFTALFIAGARSRIIITGLLILLMLLTVIYGVIFHSQKFAIRRIRWMISPLSVALLIIGSIIITSDYKIDFPIFKFFEQSFVDGDIHGRIEETVILSLVPDSVTLFGEGLGTVGVNGKPGELGIYSMWIESGLFWGSLMIAMFLGILFLISKLAVKAFLSTRPIILVIYAFPLLQLLLALSAGLTAAFELSTGILLCSIIAVVTGTRNISGEMERNLLYLN